jgi:hypothetical protein
MATGRKGTPGRASATGLGRATGAEIAASLRARRSEIEVALLARALTIAGVPAVEEPEYLEGLKVAIAEGFEHWLAALEERSEEPPPALLSQARLAARSGVGLDTVLRRCLFAHTLLVDRLIDAASFLGLSSDSTQRALRAQGGVFDRLLVAISEEHTRESEHRLRSAQQHRAEQVERLLGGEPINAELSYDLGGHHLGLVVRGPGALEAIHELAAAIDCRLLSVPRAEGSVWGWLGTRGPLDTRELTQLISERWPPEPALALGEPAYAFEGWRLTHRQAKAALPIALRAPGAIARYAEVALLACLLQDELLAASLRALYLAPLQRERDGGEVARKTLHAYFATERNVSSAAALLKVRRQTVANRLRMIEGHIGRPLSACAAEVEMALRLADLEPAPHGHAREGE